MKQGNVWKFGDDVNTDEIIPGRYLTINDPKALANHLFEGVLPKFAREVKPGDIIVAGKNFGCGSSREHAPLALKGAGIKCVIAKSFAGIFFRNAINTGLHLLECAETERIKVGDALEVDFEKGNINNKTTGETYQATPMPDFVRKIIGCGGLVGYTRAVLNAE